MRAFITYFVASYLVFSGFGGAFAEQGPPNPEERPERLEWVVMWRLADYLDLDKPTADKLYDIRRKFQKEKQALVKEISGEVETLRRDLRENAGQVSDNELGQRIKTVREKRKRLQAIEDEQFAEVSKNLSVRQQAKLVIFMRDYYQEVRQLMARPERPGGPPPRGLGPRPPMGPPREGEPGPRPTEGVPPFERGPGFRPHMWSGPDPFIGPEALEDPMSRRHHGDSAAH